MDSKTFYTLWGEALQSADRETYVSEWATSSIWGDPSELSLDDLMSISGAIGNIWDVAHMPIREMLRAVGLTQAAFAIRICAPKRTVENWCSGVNTCPDYVRMLIAKDLGLLDRA